MASIANPDLLPLAEVVGELRRQIAQAVVQAEDEGLRFKLNTVELEFSVVAKRELAGDGKLKFSVLGIGAEVGAGAKVAHESVQKIKLSLTPLTSGQPPRSAAGGGARSATPDDPALVLISRKPAAKKARR